VERKTQITDAPITNRRLGFFDELVFQDMFIPAAFAQGMEQIKINMIGLEFAQLAIDMSPA
jgi:hypothetical protein